MFFGATAFSEVPFAGLPQTGILYVGVSGIDLTTAITRVTVNTAFNVNVVVNTTGNQLIMGQGSLVTWIPINPNSSSIWTEIGT